MDYNPSIDWFPSFGQRVKELGLDELQEKGVNYDWAMPQPWVNDVVEKVGIYPRGIIWLYDVHGILGLKCGMFGRPYSITMSGYWTLKLYELSLKLGE